MRKAVFVAISAALILPAATWAQGRGDAQCRREVMKLCSITRDRSAIRECLKDKYSELSDGCQTQIKERMTARKGEGRRENSSGKTAQGAAEYRYGSDKLQALDFYPAKAAKNAPLVIFVHGGGWKRGDKKSEAGQFKADHYRQQGYAFASVNYRLLPDTPVEKQAEDVAASVSYLVKNASKLGIDSSRIVLMGHSAGAHLSALVGTDPQYFRKADLALNAVRGIIPLDGAAYDVPQQMTDGPKMMQSTYKDAFGTDPVRQRALSPTMQAQSPNAPSFLILHIAREDGTRQSKALAAALQTAGTKVQIQGFDGKGLKGHAEINRSLGDPNYPATPVVDAWLAEIFR